ncbi:uncharacterized protein [Branchiostoma lanceolatum]|uniref:uncharacterized protein n=1 Tax=Branchiostoma lanceolatum TaxID=7740 RepID=UPI00345568F0
MNYFFMITSRKTMATPGEIAIPQSADDIAPSWVQQVLQRDLPDVIITDVDVKGPVGQGEGFMTNIIAFDAVGTRNGASQRYSLVAKLTDFATMICPKDKQIEFERVEVEFYSNTVPELLAMSNEDRSLADPFFLPKCYFAATDPSSMVSVRVMENLKTQGFSIKPDRQPLSREEMMLTAGALAQLHGLSHRLELRSGVPLPEKCVLGTFAPEVVGHLCQGGLKTFAEAFPEEKDLLARLEKVVDAKSFVEDMSNSKSQRVRVLNHGDCWTNNIMIKYEADVPTAVKLVDWQVLQYLPPTYDLAMLFLCSAAWDVFHNHRDAVLAHYHQQLQNALGPKEPLSLQSYTLEQLKADFRTDCLYGVFSRVMRMIVLRPDTDFLRMVQEIKGWGLL